MTFLSYAQNFEDVILYRALKSVRHGVYVDVGAQHPTIDSVTKAFSLMGWRGVNIEPVKHWFDMLEEDRPHDVNLNVAVGRSGSLSLFEVKGTGLSTTDAELADRYIAEGREVIRRDVRAVPLDAILAEQGLTEVHFLKVDCEGAEYEALASCSFVDVRPWVVVVEATAPNSEVSTAWRWEPLLLDRDYVRVYDDGLNLYFVASEHQELMAAFAKPPNVFDDFVRAADKDAHEKRVQFHELAHNLNIEVGTLRSTVNDLSRSLGAATELHESWRERLEKDLANAEACRSELEAERSSLQATVSSLRSKLEQVNPQELLKKHGGLLQRQHEMQREIEHLRQQIARGEDTIQMMIRSTSWRLTAPVRAIKLLVRSGGRAAWRIGRPGVARVARVSRPLMHVGLKVPGVRPIARMLAGPQSRLGRRARAFLFPHASRVSMDTPPLVMTEAAEVTKELLRAGIERNKSR